mgnify:FL=1
MRYIDAKLLRRRGACEEWIRHVERAMRDMKIDKIDLMDRNQTTEFLNRLALHYSHRNLENVANIVRPFLHRVAPSSARKRYRDDIGPAIVRLPWPRSEADTRWMHACDVIRSLHEIETMRLIIVDDHRKSERAKKAKAKTKAKAKAKR